MTSQSVLKIKIQQLIWVKKIIQNLFLENHISSHPTNNQKKWCPEVLIGFIPRLFQPS